MLWRRLSGPVLALGRRTLVRRRRRRGRRPGDVRDHLARRRDVRSRTGAPAGWIFTIARNAARDVARRRRMTIRRRRTRRRRPRHRPRRRGAALGRAVPHPRRARVAQPAGARGDRAGVLPGPHAVRDRGAHRRTARHRQDAHPQRARAPGRVPRTGGDAVIDHEDARLQLADLVVPGLADPTRTAALRAHVAVCADCRSELEDLRYVDGLVRASGPLPEPSAALEARIRAIAGSGAAAARRPRSGSTFQSITRVAGRRRRAWRRRRRRSRSRASPAALVRRASARPAARAADRRQVGRRARAPS